jgi:hypothetical protein
MGIRSTSFAIIAVRGGGEKAHPIVAASRPASGINRFILSIMIDLLEPTLSITRGAQPGRCPERSRLAQRSPLALSRSRHLNFHI